jgi:hypothetical protein
MFTNIIKRASVISLGLFIFYSISALANDKDQNRVLRIAVFDTPFCPTLIKNNNPKIIVLQPFSTDKALEKSCPKNIHGRHGLKVINRLIKVIPKLDFKVEIHPIIIFSQQGIQSPQSWKDALLRVKEKKIHVLLLAVGLPLKNSKQASLLGNININAFMASGQSSGRIRKNTIVWPQSQKDQKKSLIIGSYNPPTIDSPTDYLEDKTLLHVSKIHYFFSGGDSHARLSGSSRAVTTAFGKALSICPLIHFIDSNMAGLKFCLKTKQEIVKDPVSKYQFATY